jgi:predicted transcriptional regulator
MTRNEQGKFVQQEDSFGKPISVRLKQDSEQALRDLAEELNLRRSVVARVLLSALLADKTLTRKILESCQVE